MQTRLLHAIISGIIIAIVLGFSVIPAAWQIMSREPTFGQTTNGMATIGIIASVAIIAITLLSFKLVRRAEE
jgi:polyferredoxin